MDHMSWIYHPAAIWTAAGAVLLAVEMMTGSGWLLWPAAAAAVPALLALGGAKDDVALQAIVFAATAIVLTVIGRRYLRHLIGHHPRSDLNDPKAALIGAVGQVTSAGDHGQCRVFVGGKEWAAETEGEQTPISGARVEVLRVIGGARLAVRAAV